VLNKGVLCSLREVMGWTHIWTRPNGKRFFQTNKDQMQSYIRPVYEQFIALALMGIRASNPHHFFGLFNQWVQQVFRKPV